MKNPFLKYLMKEKKENIFHSSEYGRAQSAGIMGTTSTQSFEERMKVDKNRQIVQSYNDSRIVSGSRMNRPKAKEYVLPESGEQPKNAERVKNLEQPKDFGVAKTTAIKSPPRPTLAEAPKRNFVPPIRPNFGK